MAYQIVVPLDMSDVSESSLPVARALASQIGATIALISVIEFSPDFDDFVSPREFREDTARLKRELSTYLEGIAATFPDVPVETVVRVGDPLDEIDNLVDSLDQPLVVMASHGRTGLRRHLIGSVTWRVVHSVSCPVVVVKAGAERTETGGPIRRVLVPLDGSALAEAALDVVSSVFGEDVAELHLVRVSNPVLWRGLPAARMGYYDDDRMRDASASYLRGVAGGLKDRGVRTLFEVREGIVSDAILEAAAEGEVDMVVMATHGRAGLQRVLMGSQAERVLRDAELPVMLVRPTEPTTEDDVVESITERS